MTNKLELIINKTSGTIKIGKDKVNSLFKFNAALDKDTNVISIYSNNKNGMREIAHIGRLLNQVIIPNYPDISLISKDYSPKYGNGVTEIHVPKDKYNIILDDNVEANYYM